MQAVIGRFYKKHEDAIKEALRMQKKWNNRVQYFVFSFPNGNLVVSETQALKCVPKLARYTKRNYRGKIKML